MLLDLAGMAAPTGPNVRCRRDPPAVEAVWPTLETRESSHGVDDEWDTGDAQVPIS